MFRRVSGLALLALLTPASEAATFRVGGDAACTHTTIQAAIDAAAANGPDLDAIRINTGTYTAQALLIEDHKAHLLGGYADCAATTPTPGARSAISGAGNGGLPVLRILASGAVSGLTALHALDISGGDAGTGDGGGIRAIGTMQLDFYAIRIHDNSATRGGGIYLRGTPGQQRLSLSLGGTQGEDTRSLVDGNVASDGGGVFVDNDASLSISGRIASNQAERGGGVFVSGANAYASLTPTQQSVPSDSDISDNEASLDGGGLYASGGATVSNSRFAGSPAPQIRGNRAGRDGGGAYLDHAVFYLLRGFVRDNQAGLAQAGRGGGLFVGSGSSGRVSGDPFDTGSDLTCLSSLPCAGIVGNRAGSPGHPGEGGGFYAEGQVSVHSAALQDNAADEGAAGSTSGNTLHPSLISVLITGNSGGGSLLSVAGGASLSLHGSTLAANTQAGDLLRLDAATADIRASILHQPAGTAVNALNTSTLSTQCVIALTDFHPEGDVIVALPGFADAGAGNFRLAPDSPAQDACADWRDSALTDYDYALQLRGVDLPAVADVGGPYDIGAFETQIETHLPPLAHDVNANTTQNTAIVFALDGSDPDGDALTFTVIEAPQHGSVSSGVPPEVTYIPTPGHRGSDSFRYVANDGEFDSAPATATITILNQPPVAQGQSVSTSQDTPLSIRLEGSDPGGDALTFSVIETPTHGSLSGAAPDLVYTPDDGYTGTDHITFTVDDGADDSAPATVDIEVVADVPTGDAIFASGFE